MAINKNLPNVLQFLLIYGTFFLSFVLSTIPWSVEFAAYKPFWILVLLIYWSDQEPNKVSYITALILGVLMDSLSATHIGQHAICYIFVIILNHRLGHLFKNVTFFLRFLFIAFLITVYSLVFAFLELFSHNFLVFNANFYGPIVSSSVIWLWIHFALDLLQYWLASRFSTKLAKK